ncbi:MAG: hypothetical protein ACTSRS_01585 [Candidatus Helarchaeota archaeon]
MRKRQAERENERKLRIAYEALDECNKIHDLTGQQKVPLDKVAENLAITKEEIQMSFDYLVQLGVIGDDGDRDHMNYDEGGELLELILQLLIELSKEKEKKEIEEEEIIIQYIE